MGKNTTGRPLKCTKGGKSTLTSTAPAPLTTSGVRDNDILGYKIRGLLYDLKNVAKDVSSERRLNLTTDEHYISAPYFLPDQAAVVKAALIDVDLSDFMDPTDANYAYENEDNINGCSKGGSLSFRLRNQPLDSAIRMMLDNFFEKRKASGDTRPCGPHDLAPVYAALFGIDLAELDNERFLSRLRRAGV